MFKAEFIRAQERFGVERKSKNADGRGEDDGTYEGREGLSPLAVGYAWCVRITTFCMEFAALLLFGRFIDLKFGVRPWGLIVGGAIGIYVFIAGLIATVQRLESVEASDREDERKK